MTITTITPIPQPTPSSADPANFSPRADATLAGMAVAFDQFNANVRALNNAVSASAAAVAAANYVGAWSGLSGALNIPASVSHNRRVWLLVSNTSNVTSITPGVSSQWLALDTLEIQQNSQSANYTLVLADSGRHLLHPSADTTARTFTIPANSTVPFAIGTAVNFVNQNAAGILTIAITTDTMRLAGTSATGSRTLAANGIATALKITATEWLISGVGLT